MPFYDNPNSSTEPTATPVGTDNLDDAERAFEREAEQAEMEATLEQDRERTFLSEDVR
jgi:hypothetical protein